MRIRRYSGVAQYVSGGAIERMSIPALGIMPYISASIISNLTVATTPSLQQLRKEGEGDVEKSSWTRYGTLFLATVQGFAMANGRRVKVWRYTWTCIRFCRCYYACDGCYVHDVAG